MYLKNGKAIIKVFTEIALFYFFFQITIGGGCLLYTSRKARSIPAIPIAESNPPIVVGMRQTNKDRKEAMVMTVPV